MKKRKLLLYICMMSILLLFNSGAYSEDLFELPKPNYQDNDYVFLRAGDSFLILKKWEPIWYVFRLSKDVQTIKKIKKNIFLFDNDQVTFSDLKGILLFKDSRQTIQGKIIRDFRFDASFSIVKDESWSIETSNDSYTITYLWKSENVKYVFDFKTID